MARRHTLLLALLVSTLALALAGCGGGSGNSSGGNDSGQGAAGDASAGRQIFAANCATCHGDLGQGGLGPNLQRSSKAEDLDAVVSQVTNGGGSMPAFGDQFSEQQIADVAAFVNEELAKG